MDAGGDSPAVEFTSGFALSPPLILVGVVKSKSTIIFETMSPSMTMEHFI